MMSNVRIFNCLILFVLILLTPGCKNKAVIPYADKTETEIESGETDSNKDIELIYSDYKIQFEYTENLKELKFKNLNADIVKDVILKLPENWYATKATYKVADDFEFKEEKRKEIRELSEYKIYNEKIKLIGDFGYIGYYTDDPYGPVMLNHCIVKETLYKGETKIGEGAVYLLECDLPEDQVSDKYKTYERVYALIPIKKEILAYQISFYVPLEEEYEKYTEIMKEMLVEIK